MVEVLLRKSIGSLKPEVDEAIAFVGNLANGQEVVCEIKDPRRRSTEQHRYWFKLLHLAWENNEALQVYFRGNFDHFRETLLIELGYGERYKKKDGTWRELAKSVSFAKMEQHEFTALVDKTLEFFKTEFGMDPETLREEAA